MKSIQSTFVPIGYVNTETAYNNWFAFIHRIKPIQNNIKQGGVCLNWAMEKTLQQAKEVLNGKG